MSEDQFTKLFKYIEKRFDAIDGQFENNRKDHLDIRGATTDLGSQIKDYHQNY